MIRAITDAFRRLWALPLGATLTTTAYVINSGLEADVYAQTMVRPVVVGVGGAAMITVALVLIARGRDLGGLLAAGVFVAVLTGSTAGAVLTRTNWWQAALWLALIGAALLLAARITRRRSRAGRALPSTRTANLLSALLLSVVLVTGLVAGRAGDLAADIGLGDTNRKTTTNEPDIIVVLLDGYPRGDTLKRLFEFDNTTFLDGLADRGFAVAAQARSNYAWTELTLLSMLHMRHATDLPAFRDLAAKRNGSQPWLRGLTNENPVFEIVRERGYRVVTIAPGIDHVALRAADETYTPPGLSDFEFHVLSSTVLAGALAILDPAFFARDHRNQILWSFDTLERTAMTNPGGRLILAHIFSPHLPAVFNHDGSLRRKTFDDAFYTDFRAIAGASREEWTREFRDQVAYLNVRVLEMLDRVTAASPEATIILMSDHGSGSEYRANAADSDIAERYSTLFAARTPGLSGVFDDDQTPVNVFPALFNVRLGLDLPRQPNTSYAGYLNLVPIDEKTP